ncbi:MAG TPA: hypothetical protein VJN68_02715 [Burkholderiaceae bacterium]|nr:hypothetical protein [Burkholderiaceae bacterium]
MGSTLLRVAVHVAAFAALIVGASGQVFAQATAKPGIYSCLDPSGKRITSDRPIAACSDREQRELNADGSVKRIVPPTMTADERTEAEAREREAATERANRVEALRRDRNLLARFPNEAAHYKAREAALDDSRKSVKLSESRLTLLASERKPLMDEAEFYVGKPLPAKLRTQLDANDAATDAQRTLIQNQQAEIIRVNGLYDAELQRLRKLWSGAQPGTLGTLPAGETGAAPRKAAGK